MRRLDGAAHVSPDPASPLSSEDPFDAAELVDLGQVTRPVASRRGMSVPVAIAAAVVVIVGGIVFANRPDPAITAASPAVSPAAPVPATPDPVATSPTVAPPPCVLLSGVDTPELELSWAGEDRNPVVASQWPFEPAPPDDWSAPFRDVAGAGPRARIVVAYGASQIVLTTQPAGCLAEVRAEAVRLDAVSAISPWPLGSAHIDASGARAMVTPPPAGEWLLRIVAETPTSAGSRWIEAYAWISIGIGGGGNQIPLVTPVVPCGPETDGETGVDLYIDGVIVPGVTPGPGGALPSGIVPSVVPFGSTVEIRTAGDRCALAWTVDAAQRPGPSGTTEVIGWETPVYEPVVRDPRIAAQNRFGVGSGTPGEWALSADVQFADGTRAAKAWAVRMEALDVPALRVGAINRPGRVTAWIGCGFGIEQSNGGHFGGDSCVSNLPQEPLETLIVARGSRLTFEVDGWVIGDWFAGVGSFRGAGPAFEDSQDGFLRSASSPPVDFPVPATVGLTTLKISGSISRDGVRIYGEWFVMLDVR